MIDQSDQWAITVAARQSSLGEVAEFIGGVCDNLQLSDDIAFDVKLATDEACQNVVEHACEFSTEERVRVSCRLVGSDLEVVVSDKGRPFDPEAVSPPDISSPLKDRAEGGLGLYLMKQVMDDVRFNRSSDGVNSVTMIKKDASPSAQVAAAPSSGSGEPANSD